MEAQPDRYGIWYEGEDGRGWLTARDRTFRAWLSLDLGLAVALASAMQHGRQDYRYEARRFDLVVRTGRTSSAAGKRAGGLPNGSDEHFNDGPWVHWASADYPGLSREQLAMLRRDKKEKYPEATDAQIEAAIRAVLRPGSLRGREVGDVEREAMRDT